MTTSPMRSTMEEETTTQLSSLTTPKMLHFSESAPQNEENATNGIERSLKRPMMGTSQRSFGDISVTSSSADVGVSTTDPPRDVIANDANTVASPTSIQTCTTLESDETAGSDVESTVGSEVSVARLKGWLDDFSKQNRDHYGRSYDISKTNSMDSDCESDVSVSRLNRWLDDFGKQNKKHYDKVNAIAKAPDGVSLAKPIRAKCSASATPVIQRNNTASVVRANAGAATTAVEAKKGPSKTPVRFKPRFKKEEVQATNDGYASVKQLSAWLADGPCSDKKLCHVRRGMNVIAKSRAFEKGLANVIIEENQIAKGSVSDKASWLQSAFGDDDKEEAQDETAAHVNVGDKKKWLQNAFQKTPSEDGQTDDSEKEKTTSMGVSDKKKWLQNAFKKEEEKQQRTKAALQAVSRADGISAKERVQTVKPPSTVTAEGNAPKPSECKQSKFHTAIDVETAPSVDPARTLVPSTVTNTPDEPSNGDQSELDFKAARQLLVERSAQNGNPVKVFTQVDRKKQKFERLQKENRRKSAAHGLLKTSWEQADASVGPTTGYTKMFVSDVAPKKSFEDLP